MKSCASQRAAARGVGGEGKSVRVWNRKPPSIQNTHARELTTGGQNGGNAKPQA